MNLQYILKKLPLLPLTALVFYLGVLLLWRFNLIPSPSEIVMILENIYLTYGLWGIGIAAFLEGIVYLGLYFPGSFIIAFAIFLSDGSLKSIFAITFVVSITWTITCIIDYLLGRFVPFKKNILPEKKKFSKGFLFSFLHQNILAFYFFNEGIEKKNPWKLLIVFPIMFIWGFVIVSLFSFFREYLRNAAESPYTMIILILIWISVAFIFEHKRKNKIK